MLRFFRRIRQALINNGSMKKYILYAIGEILLVMIGILLALQVNNWNESQKEAKIEANYIERLKFDLQNNTTVLSDKIRNAIVQQKLYKEFVVIMYKTQHTKDDFRRLLETVVWDRNDLILQDKTYLEMTNSGRFANMKQSEVKESIRDYYILYEQTAKHISEMNESGGTIFLQIYPQFIKYYQELSPLFKQDIMFRKKDWEFVNNPTSEEFKALESAAAFYYFKETVFEVYYEEMLAEAERLLQSIHH